MPLELGGPAASGIDSVTCWLGLEEVLAGSGRIFGLVQPRCVVAVIRGSYRERKSIPESKMSACAGCTFIFLSPAAMNTSSSA